MNPSPKKGMRVRLAPSPTGRIHVGLVRTGLFNWLLARQHGGEFLLRIEDTDTERSKKEYEDEIVEGLRWLGLEWDGPIYRQSERLDVYEKYLRELIDKKAAYFCYCTKEELESQRQLMMAESLPPKYSGHCRELAAPPKDREPQVIRMRVPELTVTFKDLVRGEVKFDTSLFGDIVIAKNLRSPLYNFAVVVDDHEMKITHVIRGEDHISNTPKQILLQRVLEFETPIYGHIPLILAADRSKLSKRTAEVSLLEYRKRGYLPEAMINFLALLGWHPTGENELLTLADLVKEFDIDRVQKSGAIFNEEKLNWLNREHIKRLGEAEILKRLEPWLKSKALDVSPDFLKSVIRATRDRMQNLAGFFDLADFFFDLPSYDRALLKWKDQSLPDVKINLLKIKEALEVLSSSDFDHTKISELVESILGDKSKGEFFWPFRVALSGKMTSPDPGTIVQVLGKEEAIRRIDLAVEKIDKE